ncbi:MAG: hypothetical protein E7575_00790 [Ruminococcaceae bacterium]|nr:hypothetical protein [Oscillospiraceae bacterium]
MYSKNKGLTDRDYPLTPPPGYDGSRFRRRSDGRDDAFPMYGEQPMSSHGRKRRGQSSEQLVCPYEEKAEELAESSAERAEAVSEDDCDCAREGQCTECPDEEKKDKRALCEEKKREGVLSSLIRSLGSEEVLLIALMVLLAGDSSREGMDTVLMLALLLCI